MTNEFDAREHTPAPRTRRRDARLREAGSEGGLPQPRVRRETFIPARGTAASTGESDTPEGLAGAGVSGSTDAPLAEAVQVPAAPAAPAPVTAAPRTHTTAGLTRRQLRAQWEAERLRQEQERAQAMSQAAASSPVSSSSEQPEPTRVSPAPDAHPAIDSKVSTAATAQPAGAPIAQPASEGNIAPAAEPEAISPAASLAAADRATEPATRLLPIAPPAADATEPDDVEWERDEDPDVLIDRSRLHDEADHHDDPEALFALGEHHEPPKRRLGLGCLFSLILVGLLLGVAAVGWMTVGPQIMAKLEPKDYSASESDRQPVEFHVESGDTGDTIAAKLVKQGIIKSTQSFYDAAHTLVDEPVFQPGTFPLTTKMRAIDAINVLKDPKNLIQGKVTIPEGTRMEVAFDLISKQTKVKKADLEAAAKNVKAYGLPPEATSLEGFLFPTTYDFGPTETAEGVLKTMVGKTKAALDAAGVPAEKRWDVIRLASVVEREAGNAQDAAKVARVFLNRNAKNMPWQSDATITYWTKHTDRVDTTDAERADAANPYNTYVHNGTVVAPISNPGEVTIRAAAHPADGPWLYFVTVNPTTGETAFSTTLAEHEANAAKFNEWLRNHPRNT